MSEQLGGLMTSRIIEDNFGRLSDLQSFDKHASVGVSDFSQEKYNLILAFVLIGSLQKYLEVSL
jgi:hypothetical protein